MKINPQRNTKSKIASRIFVLVICLTLITANSTAQKRDDLDNSSAKNSPLAEFFAPTPIPNPGGNGNATCADLNASSDPAFAHILLDNELKLDFTPPSGLSPAYPFTTGSGRIVTPAGAQDPNAFVRIFRTNNTFDFFGNKNITAVIVKGGSINNGGGVNVYPYPFGKRDDTGLTTIGGQFGVSHISFCFDQSPALIPSAGIVSIEGRVLSGKSGIRNALVYLTDQNGETKIVRTNSFGYYRFADVRAGGSYVLNVSAKRYVFSPQVITANGNLGELNFVAER